MNEVELACLPGERHDAVQSYSKNGTKTTRAFDIYVIAPLVNESVNSRKACFSVKNRE